MAVTASVSFACLSLMLMASRTLGDACESKQRACANVVAEEATVLGPIMQSLPIDTAMFTQQCSSFEGRVKGCVDEMRSQCPGVRGVDTKIQQLQTNFNSMCSPEIICSLRLQGCGLGMNTTTAEAAAQNPPNAQLSTQKCGEIMACMEELKADCSSVPTVKAAIASGTMTLGNLCGKGEGSMMAQGSCPQIMSCMQNAELGGGDCSSLGTVLECISDKRDVCTLDETQITFAELKVLADDVCQEVASAPAEYEKCPALNTCIMQNSEFVKEMTSMGANMERMQEVIASLINSGVWCKYLETSTRCHVSSADSCNFSADFVTAISMKHTNLKAVCATGGAASGVASLSLWLSALVLLITWRQCAF
ncbi:uncharacterized protein [Littorina saxatilis]|uniref:Uncharacterized protein n=1 Tax=Littorina saxatilis TaxID=31220 RepID=A0AAN9G8D4_9CAEN